MIGDRLSVGGGSDRLSVGSGIPADRLSLHSGSGISEHPHNQQRLVENGKPAALYNGGGVKYNNRDSGGHHARGAGGPNRFPSSPGIVLYT